MLISTSLLEEIQEVFHRLQEGPLPRRVVVVPRLLVLVEVGLRLLAYLKPQYPQNLLVLLQELVLVARQDLLAQGREVLQAPLVEPLLRPVEPLEEVVGLLLRLVVQRLS
jgi:hypothetical protein